MAIAAAAKTIISDGVDVMVGGGIESISLVQNEHMNRFHAVDAILKEKKPELYMPMIDTAEIVAKRYNIGRDVQDEYSLESQRRIALAQKEGRLDKEIVPITDDEGGRRQGDQEVSYKPITISKDEGNRPETTLEGLRSLKPVRGEGKTVTAGNASQLSDGASASVLDGAQARGEARHAAARHLSRPRGRRLRAGRDGHRPGVRDPAPARSATA